MMLAAAILGVFAITSAGLVAVTYDNTKQQIAANHRAALIASLHELIAPEQHDNDLYSDTITVQSKELLGTAKPVTVYRARKHGMPVAAILASVAPDGYSGSINLLVAIYYDGRIAGVRVTEHKETPGLGDLIEVGKSDWINNFRGKSPSNPDAHGWHVRKDGGIFDQFTGATITPRAVVKAVNNTLRYFETNKQALFAPAISQEIQNGG
ncbi:MAG: electron transport complex subunit RsxG [Gammaproteobacteria bacterium]|nr:electron transport complex subunit RsxG [Gammaproteobacteria bacterium]